MYPEQAGSRTEHRQQASKQQSSTKTGWLMYDGVEGERCVK
jgi:hypothetical protein